MTTLSFKIVTVFCGAAVKDAERVGVEWDREATYL